MERSRNLVAVLASVAVFAAPHTALAAECHGVTMPPAVQVAGQRLVLNGMGVREATIFNADVYVAGLYLTERSRDGSAILARMGLMRLALELVRDVERGEMNDAIREGFERNGASAAVRGRMRELERLIPDLHDGDKITFTYLPDANEALEVHVDGRLAGRIEGADFARAVFAIWIGARPPNAGLKRGLLGGAC